MKDLETRKKEYRRRRIQVMVYKGFVVAVFIVFIGLIALAVSAAGSGYKLNPADAITVHYAGFDGAASAEIVTDYQELIQEMDKAYAKYEAALWPVKKTLTKEDFESFANTISCSMDKSEALNNGDEINIAVAFDEELSKHLDINVAFTDIPLKVEGLKEGKVITDDDLFKDVKLNVDGISPLVTVELVNESTDDFLKTVKYTMSPEKQYYRNGEKVKVTASFDNDLAVAAHYDVQEGDHSKTRTINVPTSYVESIDQIDEETFKAAYEAGKLQFTDANEYGLRIFTEAGLRYTWVGTADYTFEWSNPRIISAYVETLKDPDLLAAGKTYNYLEIVYDVHISQANGTGCNAEAVVAFNELTIDENGKVDFNEESGQLFSASYLDKNIKSSLRGWFGDDYNLEKFDLSTMNLD